MTVPAAVGPFTGLPRATIGESKVKDWVVVPRSEQMVMTMVSKLSWPGGAKTTTAVFDDQLVISTAVCPILFAPVMSTVAKFWPEMVAEDPPSVGAFAPEKASREGLS